MAARRGLSIIVMRQEACGVSLAQLRGPSYAASVHPAGCETVKPVAVDETALRLPGNANGALLSLSKDPNARVGFTDLLKPSPLEQGNRIWWTR